MIAKSRYLIVTFALVMTCAPAARAQPRSVVEALAKGADALNKGQLDSAIASYCEAIRLDANEKRAYLGRGEARFLKRDFGAAIVDLNEAIRLDSKSREPYVWRGRAIFENLFKQARGGYLPEAIRDYDEAINLAPSALLGLSCTH